MRSLAIRGPFRGPTGYDQCVRGFARELHGQGVALEMRDMPEWSPAKLPAAAQDPLFSSLERPVDGIRTALQFCTPLQALPYAGKIDVNFTMFEASRVPAAWIAESRRRDLLIVPTESSRSAWLQSGMPAHRIRICPLGVAPALFSGTAEPLPLRISDGRPISAYRVRFLNISEFCTRKNLMGLLQAWIEGTSKSDDAVLIVKIGCYNSGSWDRFARQIEILEQRIGKDLSDAAPVAFLRGVIADAGMPGLYAAATHYISLSFGEGWDLPMTEAAASGLKLIAPAHSAYLAYLNSTVAVMIPSREIPAHDPDDPAVNELFRGANWWEPDRRCAVEALRAAIENRDSHVGSARRWILDGFTWAQAARRLTAVLDERENLRARIPSFSALQSNRRANTEKRRCGPGAPPTPNPS